MMDTTFSEKIIDLKITANRISLGAGEHKSLFSLKYDLLYLIGIKNYNMPKQLIRELNLAKSNIALMCNDLCKQGLIVKKKEQKNKKLVCYYITENGKKTLNEKLLQVEKFKMENKEEVIKQLELTLDKLKEFEDEDI